MIARMPVVNIARCVHTQGTCSVSYSVYIFSFMVYKTHRSGSTAFSFHVYKNTKQFSNPDKFLTIFEQYRILLHLTEF